MKKNKIKKILLLALSSIMIFASVPTVESDASQLTVENDNEHLEISESLIYTDYSAPYKKITLLPSVMKAEASCFTDNLYIEEVAWNASTDNIPLLAFNTCPKLKKVTIANNVKTIGTGAFNQCISLTNVTLPKNLKSIGFQAFFDCTSLKTLYIPESVTEIGAEAFLDCDSLVIHGKKNSYAYYYCKMNNIPFVSEGTASHPATDRPYIKSTYSKVINKQVCSTIVLNGKVKDADGYQYQFCDKTYARKVLASKNSKNISYTFKKTPTDTLGYARVRSYKILNGKKIYSEWSNEMPLFSVGAEKDNIKLKKITVGKEKISAQFSKLKYSDGIDCVLKSTNSEKNIVLKNQNKTTITFKNLKPGTYYLKAHAYTIINGSKQFGLWSENKKVIVK